MNKENIKFSIIVPAYNVENYIGQCVESVFNQTYSNWELIIVDDGSIDKTREYLNGLKHNKKVKIVFSKHVGVSGARNIGLKKATGDYIVFLDSDDYLELWVLDYINKKVLKKSTDAYLGMFNTIIEDGISSTCHSEILQKRSINNRTHEELLEYFYKIRLIFTVWRFIVKKEIIVKNNIYFKEKVLHEDEDWVTRLLLYINNMTLIDSPFYNYRIRKNSIMTTKNKDVFRLKNDSRYQHACNFLDMAEKTEIQYIKDFLYRCAYKNVQQIYLDIKKNAHPYYPQRRRRK